MFLATVDLGGFGGAKIAVIQAAFCFHYEV